MTPLLIVAIVAIAIALTVRSARRALAERDAVDRHHRALDLLGSLTDRPERVEIVAAPHPHKPRGKAKRAAPGDPATLTALGEVARAPTGSRHLPAPVPVAPPSPPTPPRPASPSMPAHRVAPMEVSPVPTAPPVPPGPIVPAPSLRGYQPRHRATRRGHRSPRPLVVVAAFVLLVSGGVAGGLLLRAVTQGGRPTNNAASPTAATGATASTRPAGAAATSTSVAATPVVLAGSDSQQARYTVAQPSANVALVLTSACWIEIRSNAGTGPVVFSGTLRAGTRRPLPTSPAGGGIKVLLGNPAGVSLSVDGTKLAIPIASGTQPFTLIFQPPA